LKTRWQRIVESRWFVPAVILAFAALAGLLFALMGTRAKGEVEILLSGWIPKVLWINFLLILIGLLACRRDIAGAFRGLFSGAEPSGRMEEKIPFFCGGSLRRRLNRPAVYLALILLAGYLLVSQVAPQTHRIYFDEDIYANMAQNIALTGQAGMANYATFEYGEYFVNWLQYNKDPAGWPFLVGLAFQLLGTDEVWMFHLNNLLFCGGILLVFFITRIVAGGVFPGLIGALVFALIPHNLIWSNTGAAEPASAFFGGAAVLCVLVWLRSRAWRHLFLMAVLLPFACAMRPEAGMIGLWALAAVAANTAADTAGGSPEDFRHPFLSRRFWAAGIAAFALLVPHIWHIWAVSGHSWGAEGAKFAFTFFGNNLSTNGLYYLDNAAFPVLFTLLAVLGLAAGLSKDRRLVGLIGLWWFLFWGIFLFFYAGSYRYGADVRFAVLSFMPLAVLAGIGGGAVRGWLERIGTLQGTKGAASALLVLVLLLAWLKFLPLVRLVGQEAWGARYDHNHAREFIKKIPERSIVLTHVPTMFLVWGQNAIQAYAGVNNPDLIRDLMARYGGNVYFHQSYWCNTQNDSNRLVCEVIRGRYDLAPVATAREQTNEYGLYRMTFKPPK